MVNKPQRNSRQAILDRLATGKIDHTPLPDIYGEGTISAQAIGFDDPAHQFVQAVAAAGGTCIEVADPGQVSERLQEIETYQQAQNICSVGVDEVNGNVVMNDVQDAHDLSNLDFLIAWADLGVAENGALWVPGNALRHRAGLFITQHLALLVRRDAIYSNMHQAYQHVAPEPSSFGVFIAGPSKTADIEQSLVLGAHGCRTLTVFLIG